MKFWKKSMETGNYVAENVMYDPHASDVTTLLAYHDEEDADIGKSFFLSCSSDCTIKMWAWEQVMTKEEFAAANKTEEGNSTSNSSIINKDPDYCWKEIAINCYKESSPIDCGCLSPDGALAAVGCGNKIILFNTSNHL